MTRSRSDMVDGGGATSPTKPKQMGQRTPKTAEKEVTVGSKRGNPERAGFDMLGGVKDKRIRLLVSVRVSAYNPDMLYNLGVQASTLVYVTCTRVRACTPHDTE